MLQRIQTVYLFLAGLAQTLLFVPQNAWVRTDTSTALPYLADGLFTTLDFISLSVVFGCSALAAFAAILLFKNRLVQNKITRLSIVFSAIGIGFMAYLMYQLTTDLKAGEATVTGMRYGWAWVSPIFSVVAAFLALRGIGKDEATIRSMDRLR